MDPLDGWTRGTFAHDGIERPTWRRGSGPGVIVIHEIPGLTPPVIRFAQRVVDAGFTAVMPELFGTPGRPKSGPYIAWQIARACVSREFSVLAAHAASPITDWLRALARALHAELGGRGVGAVGMCLTGNFALAMAVEPALMAPVLSQPSLPFPLTAGLRAGLHVSPDALRAVRHRCDTEGLCVLGLRFTSDRTVPRARFEALRAALGSGFEAIEIDSSRGNPHGVSRDAHSVLTEHFVDAEGHPTRAACDRVLALFAERLR